MQMEIGFGGWVRASNISTLPENTLVYARFVRDDKARRLVPVELYIESTSGERLRGEHLRRLPLDLIEAVANENSGVDVEGGLGVPGPLLGIAASTFTMATWGTRKQEAYRPDWTADMHWSQLPGSGVPQARRQSAPPRRDEAEAPPPLSTPPGGRYSEDWFRQLAKSYNWALRQWRENRGDPPAEALAKQAGVSVRTVHSWTYRARREGYLPKAKQGQAG